MSNRKKYLLDRKLQLGITFSVLGVVLIVSAVIIASIAFFAAYNNGEIEEVLSVQENIVSFLKERISPMENKIYRDTLEKISANHSSNVSSLRQIVSSNNLLLASIVVFIIVQCVVLYFMGVRRTHRITGPVHVMTNYMKDVIKGLDPPGRPLRKKDELKHFYSLLKEMVEALKKRV